MSAIKVLLLRLCCDNCQLFIFDVLVLSVRRFSINNDWKIATLILLKRFKDVT
jgi:hypothetical protein